MLARQLYRQPGHPHGRLRRLFRACQKITRHRLVNASRGENQGFSRPVYHEMSPSIRKTSAAFRPPPREWPLLRAPGSSVPSTGCAPRPRLRTERAAYAAADALAHPGTAADRRSGKSETPAAALPHPPDRPPDTSRQGSHRPAPACRTRAPGACRPSSPMSG